VTPQLGDVTPAPPWQWRSRRDWFDALARVLLVAGREFRVVRVARGLR
jgi:hypothetical protein